MRRSEPERSLRQRLQNSREVRIHQTVSRKQAGRLRRTAGPVRKKRRANPLRHPVLFLILLLVLLSALVTGFLRFRQWKNEQTGREWFEAQSAYLDQFESFADQMDTVVTLYLKGDIKADDFANHLSILKAQLAAMQASYEEAKAKHPVRLGSDTYDTKKGAESVEALFDDFTSILTALDDASSDPVQVMYKYIAARQTIIDHLSAYTTARNALNGTADWYALSGAESAEAMPTGSEAETAVETPEAADSTAR